MPRKRVTELGLLPPDHPIYRTGIHVSMPLSSVLAEAEEDDIAGAIESSLRAIYRRGGPDCFCVVEWPGRAYVQFLGHTDKDELWMEAGSNRGLAPTAHMLNPAWEEKILALGFRSPNEHCPNYFLRLPIGNDADIARAAHLALSVLQQVYGWNQGQALTVTRPHQ